MWEQILDLAIKNGLWAVLFLALLVYVLKDSNKREKKYQQTIVDLTEHLSVVHEIKKEVEEVKQVINRTTRKSKAKEVTKTLETKKQGENNV